MGLPKTCDGLGTGPDLEPARVFGNPRLGKQSKHVDKPNI